MNILLGAFYKIPADIFTRLLYLTRLKARQILSRLIKNISLPVFQKKAPNNIYCIPNKIRIEC